MHTSSQRLILRLVHTCAMCALLSRMKVQLLAKQPTLLPLLIFLAMTLQEIICHDLILPFYIFFLTYVDSN